MPKKTSKKATTSSATLPTTVKATRKSADSQSGSFWALLARLASKPVNMDVLISKAAQSGDGQRAKMKPDVRLSSTGIRVRHALRNGYLQPA